VGLVRKPIRRCIVCRRSCYKPELLRLVLNEGLLCYDSEQRLPGRGAYVHKSVACVTAVFTKGQLERAFRRGSLKINDSQKEEVTKELMSQVENNLLNDKKNVVTKKNSLRL